jgi:hypothetical protein
LEIKNSNSFIEQILFFFAGAFTVHFTQKSEKIVLRVSVTKKGLTNVIRWWSLVTQNKDSESEEAPSLDYCTDLLDLQRKALMELYNNVHKMYNCPTYGKLLQKK